MVAVQAQCRGNYTRSIAAAAEHDHPAQCRVPLSTNNLEEGCTCPATQGPALTILLHTTSTIRATIFRDTSPPRPSLCLQLQKAHTSLIQASEHALHDIRMVECAAWRQYTSSGGVFSGINITILPQGPCSCHNHG